MPRLHGSSPCKGGPLGQVTIVSVTHALNMGHRIMFLWHELMPLLAAKVTGIMCLLGFRTQSEAYAGASPASVSQYHTPV